MTTRGFRGAIGAFGILGAAAVLAGIPLPQVLLLGKSNCGDGLAVRSTISKVADPKGRTIAVDGSGTSPYCMPMMILKRSGMT